MYFLQLISDDLAYTRKYIYPAIQMKQFADIYFSLSDPEDRIAAVNDCREHTKVVMEVRIIVPSLWYLQNGTNIISTQLHARSGSVNMKKYVSADQNKRIWNVE